MCYNIEAHLENTLKRARHYGDEEPLIVGGLWEEWVNKNSGEVFRTCSIITTIANQLMSQIHNNPKLSESRMPFILKLEDQEYWLNVDHKLTQDDLQNLIKPFDHKKMKAHTVQRLSGKQSLGNVIEAKQAIVYQELENSLLL